MGADSFHAYYGLKIEIDPDDEEAVSAFETETHPIVEAAERVGLQTYFGRTTEGEAHWILVGAPLGNLGAEYESHVEITLANLTEVATHVRTKLREAGLQGEPKIHVQLSAQY